RSPHPVGAAIAAIFSRRPRRYSGSYITGPRRYSGSYIALGVVATPISALLRLAVCAPLFLRGVALENLNDPSDRDPDCPGDRGRAVCRRGPAAAVRAPPLRERGDEPQDDHRLRHAQQHAPL